MPDHAPTPDASDADLLRAFRAGDVGAFDALVRKHEAGLLRQAALLARDAALAEDAVQETFLTLARTPPDPADPLCRSAGIGAWLHRVTRNHVLDAMRSATRRRDREAAAQADRPPTAHDDGLAAVEGADTRALVERTLEALPEDQREAVSLRLLHDRTYAEIAAITGRKVGTVGWLISRGMRSLAQELSPLLRA